MKTKTMGVITLGLVLGLSGMADADTVELDLFSLGCPTEFTFGNPYWQTNFDLGTGFIEISHVYIDWSGEITAGLAIDPYNPDEPFPLDVGIYASMGYPRRTEIWGGQATYPAAEPFDCLCEIPSGTSSWSDLLDGQSSITIGYTELVGYLTYVEHGLVHLSDATLVVEGIIPEPASLLLLSLGGLFLRKKSFLL